MFNSVNNAVKEVIAAAKQRPRGGAFHSNGAARAEVRALKRRSWAPDQRYGYCDNQTLIAELLTLAPIETAKQLHRLMSHLIVVRATLRANPPFSKRLVLALHNLIREVEQLDPVADSYEERPPRYGAL